jgi:hypothetical protein
MPTPCRRRHASSPADARMLPVMSNNRLSTAASRPRPDTITDQAAAEAAIFASVRRRLGRTRPVLAAGLLVPALALGLGCQGTQAKNATAAVVGKVVELGKGTTAGIAEGFSEGREAGDSVDGARVVNSWDELIEDGEVTIHRIEQSDAGTTVVTLAVSNTGDVPLRVAELRVLALDSEGFALKPLHQPQHAVTVPPKARERITITFDAARDEVSAVRVYDHDLKPR